MSSAIETHSLRKVYQPKPAKRRRPGSDPIPQGVVAVDALDLTIDDGEFFGLLGPNGAGKTTAIGILTTRIRPTAGQAIVAGADVVTDSVRVRQTIGVVPQRPNADLSLNVMENLQFHAAYFGIPAAVATQRAHELLGQLGLSE